MRLSELIKKRRLTRFSSAIPLLLPIYMDAHVWNEDDYYGEVYERKKSYITEKVLLFYINKYNVEGTPIYERVYDCNGNVSKELDLNKSNINIVKLIKKMVDDKKDNLIFSDELLIAAGIEPANGSASDVNISREGNLVQGKMFYEDVISDETILKLMDLPMPKLKQQVAMLAAEKKKTDAAIMVAAKIGLMFCEEGLHKPVTEKQFLVEYKKHLDMFPFLPDTTIKRIYKNLPAGYRFSRDGGQMPGEQADMRPVIKAAAFAGSIVSARDNMNVGSLKKSLSIEHYAIPSDGILEEIIAAVKNLEIEEDD